MVIPPVGNHGETLLASVGRRLKVSKSQIRHFAPKIRFSDAYSDVTNGSFSAIFDPTESVCLGTTSRTTSRQSWERALAVVSTAFLDSGRKEMSDLGVNETSILGGNSTGNGTVFGLPLNYVETHRGWCLFVSFLCALFASGLTLYNMYLHLRAYTRPNLQRYILRILIIVPFYAIGSFLSFWLVHQAIYFNILRDIYEAFVVYSFLELVLSFAGGESNCVSKMVGEKELDHPFPCGYCFPPMARDGRLLRACKKATIQFVFIKPSIAILSLFMLAAGEYDSTGYQWFLWIVYNGSYSIALYGLLVFYLATKHILAPFSPVLKFFAVKSVIFMTFWQTLMISSCPNITVEQAFAWNDFIISCEMVPVAIMYFVSFGARQFQARSVVYSEEDKEKLAAKQPTSPGSGEVVKNMKEVLNVKDIVADAYHNFMPSYQDYMLQRADDEDLEKSDTSGAVLEAPTPVASDDVKENDIEVMLNDDTESAAPVPDSAAELDEIHVDEKPLSPPAVTSPRPPSPHTKPSRKNSLEGDERRTKRSLSDEMHIRQEDVAIPFSMSDEEEDETLLVSPRKTPTDKASLLK
ncbi:hypothetical protein LEN26_020143 [Aphanomyces euteiches]|nr:hypothetical protein LEN26_020143 [Aphanomyces euteiches]KAH9128632.1 hypothetical protein AeMF1_001250 [Aphanomyces euteiches]KAH9191496.1 hypothetical protein AeNC1_006539 [Aphanomyces euteiches]